MSKFLSVYLDEATAGVVFEVKEGRRTAGYLRPFRQADDQSSRQISEAGAALNLRAAFEAAAAGGSVVKIIRLGKKAPVTISNTPV